MIKIDYIAKNYGNEIALVILLGRLYFKTVNRDEVNAFVAGNTINWNLVERILLTHQIRPFIYKVISSEAINVNPSFFEGLKKIATRIATGNFAKLQNLLYLHKLLEDAGVVNIPYKGILLSKTLFNDYISRETADIDLMVHSSDFERVMDIMLAAGYDGKYYYNSKYKSLLLKSGTEFLFVKKTPSINIKVEVHWDVTHKMMDIPISTTPLFDDSIYVTIEGAQIRTFHPLDVLTILLVHHGVNDVWRILKHVLDISIWIEKYFKNVELDEIKRRACQYRISKTTAIGFVVCRELFGIEVPVISTCTEGEIQKVLHNMLRFPPIARKKLSPENVYQQFMLRDSFSDKLRLLYTYISHSLKYNMRDVEALPLSPTLAFLYPVMKPFRLLMANERR